MNKLQELLDKKFPMPEGMSSEGHRLFTVWRDIMAEGYAAGYAARVEEYALSIHTPGYNRGDVLKKCKTLIAAGEEIAALRMFKDATGYSVTDCKNILNL